MLHKKNKNIKTQVFELLKKIPKGKVTTYKDIALAINTKSFRYVGTACAKNEKLIVLPCHRVVKSDGKVGNYSKGSDKKIELLRAEGLKIENGRIKSFENKKVNFKYLKNKLDKI